LLIAILVLSACSGGSDDGTGSEDSKSASSARLVMAEELLVDRLDQKLYLGEGETGPLILLDTAGGDAGDVEKLYWKISPVGYGLSPIESIFDHCLLRPDFIGVGVESFKIDGKDARSAVIESEEKQIRIEITVTDHGLDWKVMDTAEGGARCDRLVPRMPYDWKRVPLEFDIFKTADIKDENGDPASSLWFQLKTDLFEPAPTGR
jgi:hypothetical protein